MQTSTVVIIGAVGVGAYLLLNSQLGQVLIKPRSKSPLSGVRDVVLDAKDIADGAKSMFDTGKSIWNSFTGLFDSTNETAPVNKNGTVRAVTNDGTSFVNKLANTSDWIL